MMFLYGQNHQGRNGRVDGIWKAGKSWIVYSYRQALQPPVADTAGLCWPGNRFNRFTESKSLLEGERQPAGSSVAGKLTDWFEVIMRKGYYHKNLSDGENDFRIYLFIL